MLRFIFAFAVSVSLVCFSSASGSIIVDQFQLGGATNGFSDVDPVADISAQSFVSGAGINNISGARIALASGSLSSITLEIYSVIGQGNPAATGIVPVLVANQTLNTSFSSQQVIQVDLSTPVSILPNTTYFLAFHGGAGDSGFFGGTADLYSDGIAITNPNRSGFTEFENFDFYFETLTDTTFVAAVPEPSCGLLYAVCITSALLRRRRCP